MAGALGAGIGGSLGWSANSRTVQRSDACHAILTLSSLAQTTGSTSPTSTYSAARPEPPSSWTSTAQPQGPTLQGFHLDARYEIKIHTDGSALEDLTYWVTFGPADQAGEQAVALHRLTGPDACDDDATGQLLAPRVAPTRRLGSRWPADVGRTGADPFYVDLRSASNLINRSSLGSCEHVSSS
jgi:hypothetical protein